MIAGSTPISEDLKHQSANYVTFYITAINEGDIAQAQFWFLRLYDTLKLITEKGHVMIIEGGIQEPLNIQYPKYIGRTPEQLLRFCHNRFIMLGLLVYESSSIPKRDLPEAATSPIFAALVVGTNVTKTFEQWARIAQGKRVGNYEEMSNQFIDKLRQFADAGFICALMRKEGIVSMAKMPIAELPGDPAKLFDESIRNMKIIGLHIQTNANVGFDHQGTSASINHLLPAFKQESQNALQRHREGHNVSVSMGLPFPSQPEVAPEKANTGWWCTIL